METIYLVEWGFESRYGTLDDPWFQKFNDLEKAVRFYDSIKIRDEWIVEYNTSRHISRDMIYAKSLSSNIDHGDWLEPEQILQYGTYGIADYRMEG